MGQILGSNLIPPKTEAVSDDLGEHFFQRTVGMGVRSARGKGMRR